MLLTLFDKYIIFQFVKNLVFSLICFIFVFILVDLFENIDKYIDAKLSLFVVFQYYYYFTPEIIKLTTPVSMLLATLFTTARLINYSEIIAIKNAGVSLIRFMVPFFIVGLIVTILSVYFSVWLVPAANKQKYSLERHYLGRNIVLGGLTRLYFQDSKNQLIFIEQYNEKENVGKKTTILVYKPDSLTILAKRIDADEIAWAQNNWVVRMAVVRSFKNGIEEISSYSEINPEEIPDINKINLKPGQILKQQLKPEEMNYSELSEFIENKQRGGHNVAQEEVDFYSKISFPFSSLIVIIFGISITTGSKKRKSLALQFGISILTSFVYLAFVKISQTFGYNGDINPMLTAWLANIVFAIIGIANLYSKNY
jgi:lipopolysaccharide export system permease protein